MNFCSKLAGTLIRNTIGKGEGGANNVVVSPLGFNIALNMVAQRTTASASEHLCRLLQINSQAAGGGAESDPLPSKLETILKMKSEDGFALKCVNKVLHDKAFPLQPSFHRFVTQIYKAEVEEVDFQHGDCHAIAAKMNSLVTKDTNNLLSKFMNHNYMNHLTRFVLINTLHFNGKWVNPFDPRITRDRKFHLSDKKTLDVPFMSGCQHYYHKQIDNFDLIKIPYKNDTLSMHIFLPNQTHKIQDLLQRIDSGNFLDQDFELEKAPLNKVLWIPKFDIEYETDELLDLLSDVIKSSSSKKMVQLLAKEMIQQTYDEDLFVDKILQKCVVKVDEAGTEAASVTEMYAAGASRSRPQPPPPPPIVVNRPFLFMIREEKSKLVLFLGVVTHPHP